MFIHKELRNFKISNCEISRDIKISTSYESNTESIIALLEFCMYNFKCNLTKLLI